MSRKTLALLLLIPLAACTRLPEETAGTKTAPGPAGLPDGVSLVDEYDGSDNGGFRSHTGNTGWTTA
jgi:hypothetical protein